MDAVNKVDEKGRTPLFYADGTLEVKRLVKAEANVNIIDNEGMTPLLHFILNEANPVIASVLLDAGADMSIGDCKHRNRALIPVVEFDNEILAGLLIATGADVNKTDDKEKTALFYAVSRYMVKTLVDAGAEVNRTDNEGKTALHCAIYNDNGFAASALIDFGANVDAQDLEGKTALFYSEGTLTKSLIDAGADIDITDKIGKTALFYAAKQDLRTKTRTLIDAGADVSLVDEETKAVLRAKRTLVDAGAKLNRTDNEGKTALHCAINNDKDLAASALIEIVDVDARDAEGKTPLHYAVMKEDDPTTFALIYNGAKVDAQDLEGKTALFYSEGSRTKSLIDAGADINIRDKTGKTAIFYAVQQNLNTKTTTLIDAGADVSIVDEEGKTVLFYAVKNKDIVRILVEKGGCDANSRDIYGRTPLFYALAVSSTSTSRWLHFKGRALLHVKDNCHLSILSFYMDNRLYYLDRFSTSLAPIQFFRTYGRYLDDEIFQSVIDAAFCKILSSVSALYSISGALNFASELMKLSSKATYNRHVIENIFEAVEKETNENKDLVKRWESLAPKVLGFLIELGANPNSADSEGNTALHYATRLPYLGISENTIMNICSLLRSFGASFNIKNHLNETPLLCCLSWKTYDIASHQQKLSTIQNAVKVCNFLIENGSSVEEVSRVGESVFHLILKIFHQSLYILHDQTGESISHEAEKLLELVVRATDRSTVNRRSVNLMSALHLWASLEYNYNSFYHSTNTTLKEDLFEKYLQRIFKHLFGCGARLNERNSDDDTPLHLCRTWTAVTILLDAGANPNVVDLLGRTPLVVAAGNVKSLGTLDRFYPDVSLEPKAFWISALEKSLDPWTVDNNGESVMSILVNSEAFKLVTALLDVACEKKCIHSQAIAISLLNAICKDESPRSLWKSILVEKILKSSKNSVLGKENEESPLHYCCRNIVRAPGNSFGQETKTSAHWTIAKQLISFGADCRILDSSGLSCLDIANTCPELKEMLLKPVDIVQVPLLIPWKSISTTHEQKLAKVARRQEFQQVDQILYHRSYLARGSFGFVFAGINEKDGREVAIKRVEKLRLERPEDKREISNLTVLADCEQVVRYLSFYDDEHFSYVVLELMEGNLEEYLDCMIDRDQCTVLCLDVVSGLRYLHDQEVLHRDLKPSNILYKTHPKVCLKIADFGLSRRIDSTGSISVYSTNVGTKCWIAPEVLRSTKDYSKASDIFSCGLLLHYILAVKKHPFASVDGSKFSLLQAHETQSNVMLNKMEGWDDSICAEARHLVRNMLQEDASRRPTAQETFDHPLFWSKKKKIDLLFSVGNQPEFKCPRAKRVPPLTAVETDLQTIFSDIVLRPTWVDPGYPHMPTIYTDMMKKRKTPYDTSSVIELVRFIRNSISHVSEDKRPTPIRKLLLEDFVFLEYFPNLVIEVFKKITTCGWDTREEIKYAMKK